MTPTELQLWLAADVTERADALASLIEAGDLRLVDHDGELVLIRGHDRIVTNLEAGSMPVLPPASA
jgi:hypothetical protein